MPTRFIFAVLLLVVVSSITFISLWRTSSRDSISPLQRSLEVVSDTDDGDTTDLSDVASVELSTRRSRETAAPLPSTTKAEERVDTTDALEARLTEALQERDALAAEVAAQGRLIRELQDLIAIDSPELVATNFSAWVSAASPIDDIAADDLEVVKEIAAEFPGLRLSAAEGRWIAERNRLDDWGDFAPAWDEAVLRFLGPNRVLATLDAESAAWYREQWKDEKLFDQAR